MANSEPPGDDSSLDEIKSHVAPQEIRAPPPKKNNTEFKQKMPTKLTLVNHIGIRNSEINAK